MHALTLISTTQRPLKPMIEAALANELRLLKAAIRRSERRLLAFEASYGMPTGEFLRRFESDELQESLDLDMQQKLYRYFLPSSSLPP